MTFRVAMKIAEMNRMRHSLSRHTRLNTELNDAANGIPEQTPPEVRRLLVQLRAAADDLGLTAEAVPQGSPRAPTKKMH